MNKPELDGPSPGSQRILITTAFFAPKNEIAAVRLTNYAIELRRNGWDVDVLTVQANPYNPLDSTAGLDVPAAYLRELDVFVAPTPWPAKAVYRLRGLATRIKDSLSPRREPQGSGKHSAYPALLQSRRIHSSSRLRGLFSHVRATVMTVLDSGYVRAFASAAPRHKNYDVIWASYGPRYMVDVGIRVSRKYPEATLIIDVRDPVVRRWGTETPLERRFQTKRESRIARHAEGITTVGDGLLFGPKVRDLPRLVLSNGIEPSWMDPPHDVPAHSQVGLHLFYGGRLYPTQQLDSLIVACAHYSKREPVHVHYAGRDGAAFRTAFNNYGLGHLVTDHGYLSRAESKTMLAHADAAVLLSWNTQETDVLTGKVYELIASNRPIICLINGDLQTSALFRLFEGDGIRHAFSAASDTGASEEILDFLTTVRQLGAESRLRYDGRTRYHEYSYESLSRRLSSFLTEAVIRHQTAKPRPRWRGTPPTTRG